LSGANVHPSISGRSSLAASAFVGGDAAAHAAPTSLHGHYSGHAGYLGLIRGYEPQQSMAPQFNNPGPQIRVPQTGNAMDQLSPLVGAGQPDALGIK
jgi:hypothetical protein